MAPIWLQLKGVIVGIVHFVSDPGRCGSTNDNAVCRCVLGDSLLLHCLDLRLGRGCTPHRRREEEADVFVCGMLSTNLHQEYVGKTKPVTSHSE